jgi:hypothetical protein
MRLEAAERKVRLLAIPGPVKNSSNGSEILWTRADWAPQERDCQKLKNRLLSRGLPERSRRSNFMKARIIALTVAGILVSGFAWSQSTPNFVSSGTYYTIRNGGPAGGDCTVHFLESSLPAKQQITYQVTGVETCNVISAPISRSAVLTSSTKRDSIQQMLDVSQSLHCAATPSYSNVMIYDTTNSVNANVPLN